MHWKTSRRIIDLERPLVMGILNVTPDSFSDGGRYSGVDAAVSHAEQMIEDGADIIDIGGESTRPGSERVPAEEEIARVVPVIKAIAARFDVPLSIDTSKSTVALEAVATGAEVINDISGLRFDPGIADVTFETGAGLVLMHSRSDFGSMHSHPPVDDIMSEVLIDLHRSTAAALARGVRPDQIVVDIGVGFGKTLDQNLELLAKLGRLVVALPAFPILVGTSRKSFIGKLLGGVPSDERLIGSIASVVVAVWNGARIVRVHDVAETVKALRIVNAIKEQK